MKHGVFSAVAVSLAVVFCLCGCAQLPPEQTLPPTTADPNLSVTELALTVEDAADLAALDAYPNLVRLDLRGSGCYEEILSYINSHPNVEVIYDVYVGDAFYPMDALEITVNDSPDIALQLLERIAYLPRLTQIHLPETSMSSQQLFTLQQAYPGIGLDTTVTLLGQQIDGEATHLDLSSLTPEQVQEAAAAISKLRFLEQIQLMNEAGECSLSPADVKILMDAALPGAVFDYRFQLFGKTLSTADERVEYRGYRIGNEGVAQIRQALDIMPRCTYFLLDQCGIDYEILSQLNQEYPDTQIVWRIFYGSGQSILTDATVFRCVGDLTNHNSRDLKYLTEVVYLDAGHNFVLSDLSFVSYMPNLKVAIFSDCKVSDLTPFSQCGNLQYIEIVNCNALTDLTPLASCTNLKGLNMSWVFSIKDLSPLYTLQNLERLYMGRNEFPKEVIEEARAALPNCWVTDYAESVAWISFNYSVGWRLDDEHTFAEWYKEIKEVFGYTREIY